MRGKEKLRVLAGVALTAGALLLVEAGVGTAAPRDEDPDAVRYRLSVTAETSRGRVYTVAGGVVAKQVWRTRWAAKTTRAFPITSLGRSYRFRALAVGSARRHTGRGWMNMFTATHGPCAVPVRDQGILGPSRIEVRVFTARRRPYLTIAVPVAEGVTTSKYHRTMCPTRVSWLPDRPFPGTSLPCGWCLVRPVTLRFVYQPKEIRHGRRFTIVRVADETTKPALGKVTRVPKPPLFVQEPNVPTSRETTADIRWVLRFTPVR
jgi:hypothetical protein